MMKNNSKSKHSRRRPATHAKKVSQKLGVTQSGDLTVNSPVRSLTSNGPVRKVHPKRVVHSVTKMPRPKPSEANEQVFIVGTELAQFTIPDSLNNIIAYCQNFVRVFATQFPHVFVHENAQILGRAIYPSDLVAYCVWAILGGFKRNNSLTSNPLAFTGFPEDLPVPIAIAEYISRLRLIGAPTINRTLSITADIPLTTGEVTYSSGTAINISTNQNPPGSGARWGEIWAYGSATTSTMDPNDFSQYSFTQPFVGLFGATGSGWVSSTRPTFVSEMLRAIDVGTINFNLIPKHTTDPSSFGGPGNNYYWSTATQVWFPKAGGNSSLAMVFNPVPNNGWFPGTTFIADVPRVTWAVQGGTYGNIFPSPSPPWAGQAVVPTSLDPYMYAAQCFYMITLHATNIMPRVFGKNGYKYHGLVVHDYNRFVSAPIDYSGLVQKLVSAHLRSINTADLVMNFGYVQGLYLFYGAMIFRKVLNSQVEMWSSLSGDTLTNLWNVQTLVPSQDYLIGGKTAAYIAALINQLAPTGANGAIRIPSIGAGYLANAWANGNTSSGSKWFLFPKFSGFAPSGSDYASGLILNPTSTDPGDPKTWVFPYFMGANGDPTQQTAQSSGFVMGSNSAYTIFPESTVLREGIVPAGGGQTFSNCLYVTGPVYDQVTLVTAANSYANGALNAGRETRLAWQYSGASAAVKNFHSLISKATKLNETRMMSMVPYGVVGGSGMCANVQYTINYQVSKPYDSYAFSLLDNAGGANTVSMLGVVMDYHQGGVIQAMCFFNPIRVSLAYIFSPVTYPISSQSTTFGIGRYSAGPYLNDMHDVTGMDMWDAYVCDALQPDSDFNTYIEDHAAKKVKCKGEAEGTYHFGTTYKNQDACVIEGANIATATTHEAPCSTTSFTVHEVEEATKLLKAENRDNEITASLKDINANKCIDNVDYSAKQFFGAAWKGVKEVAPKVIKGALEVAPLLLA